MLESETFRNFTRSKIEFLLAHDWLGDLSHHLSSSWSTVSAFAMLAGRESV